jgi:hypothetical protein
MSPRDLYVAPYGDDAAPRTNEKPLATLAGAGNAVPKRRPSDFAMTEYRVQEGTMKP